MTNVEHINLLVRPLLDAYRAELRRHGRAFGAGSRCHCGFSSDIPDRRRANIAVGLHVHHAWKRAEREYDVAAAELLRADLRAKIKGGAR